MRKKNIHVTRRKDKTWAVKKEGDKRASSLNRTQKAAIKKATRLAKKNQSEVVIHNRKTRFATRTVTDQIRIRPETISIEV